jgi:hypothetical protein
VRVRDELDASDRRRDLSYRPNRYHPVREMARVEFATAFSGWRSLAMRALKHDRVAIVSAASAALLSLTLFLCSIWLMSNALPLQFLALTTMSVSGSGLVALMEFR